MVSIVIFLMIVTKQAKSQDVLTFQQLKLLLLQNEVNIIENKPNIYDDGTVFENPKHAYTADLDVFGKRSLFAYLNRTITEKGNQILALWLQKETEKDIILSRQKALEELSLQHKNNLDLRAKLYLLKNTDLVKLQADLAHKLPSLTRFIQTKKITLILLFFPIVTFGVLAAAIIFNGVFWSVLGLNLLVNYVVYSSYLKSINQTHDFIGKSGAQLKSFAEVIKPIEQESWQSEALKDLVTQIKNPSGEKTHEQITDLAKIIKDFDYRYNVFIGTILNLFFFWDLRVIKRLYEWQQKDARGVLQSFDVLAEFEALLSLSNLNVNHPNWTKPEITDDYLIETMAIGHPLILENVRVNNSFSTVQNKTIDVITGSNMAGKSTFLRTLGINLVLAYAGGNVCAASFKTSIFSLVSYMRIKDSLIDQTSTFKAELDRLKMILQLTKEKQNTYILVDEMLRGTNSKDKYLGTKVFIEKLLQQQTPGLIATHDLQIAELEKDHPQKVRNFHFDIRMENEEMFFDYLIKNGECKTFNAAILLKAIGLSLN
jgi:DNA mismatch repair ATPase MutS